MPKVLKNQTSKVDIFMSELDYPFKSEVECIRNAIKSVDKEIFEEVKWNAPSFNYHNEYLLTFNLRSQDKIHLIFHNPLIPKVESELLLGDYTDRRMMYFENSKDVELKLQQLKQIILDLIKLINKK